MQPTLRSPSRRRLGAYVALTKPRIIELLLVTTVPTMVVAQRGLPPLGLILATLVGGALAAGGANALNMYVDRDIDQLMDRTKGRPLVTGEVTPRQALVFAVALEVVAAVELAVLVNPLSAGLAVSATLFYVFVYTIWLKRTSTQNIVIGGAAGAVPVLVGWAAVTGRLDWAPVVLFGVIFAWTPPHFWALAIRYREDYAAADVPMLPAVAMPQNTFLALAIFSAGHPLYDAYRRLGRAWGPSLLADQRQGGGLMWVAGDLTLLVAVLAVAAAWAAHEAGREEDETAGAPLGRPT